MKTMSITARCLVLLLALTMLLGAFASCTNGAQGNKSTTEGNAVTPTTEATENTNEDGLYYDNLPADLKFDRTFKILGCTQYKHQFWMESSETAANPVDLAIYERNLTVEERLGIEFEWEFVNGDWGSREKYLTAMQTASDGGTPHDGLIAYNLVPPVVAVRGYAANLYDAEYLDLTGPWWPSVYLKEMLVNDQIYCLVENNDIGLLRNIMAMFFNNEMLEARGMESPYELVAKNEWTIEALSTMIKDTYEDFDNDQKVSAGDIFGCSTATNAKMDCWFFSLGYQYATVREGQVISLLGEPEMNDFLSTMIKFLDTDDVYQYDAEQCKMFMDERAYFYVSGIFMAESIKFNNLEINFGVVPMPKETSEQEDYYTMVHNTHDAWCVPYNVKDLDCSGAVMECMASESYRQIGPLYFETYLKLRYAPDERLADMYDLIRESVTFDFIYLFSCVYTDSPKEKFKLCFQKPDSYNWSSMYAQYKNAWDSSFQQIVDTYAK